MSGNEKTGVLDETGVMHDLSGIVNDIPGETFLLGNIERLQTEDLIPHFCIDLQAFTKVFLHAWMPCTDNV